MGKDRKLWKKSKSSTEKKRIWKGRNGSDGEKETMPHLGIHDAEGTELSTIDDKNMPASDQSINEAQSIEFLKEHKKEDAVEVLGDTVKAAVDAKWSGSHAEEMHQLL
uniref:AlNc14C289G10205 protein n=1 Tax=Albugo laibachii Nc14 TaxID=890382 RepID=F0WV60_9STRA|nr:AlNc14C289G10205 [Albugo laibachii Nc14]|eukprot:CCA25299.1 AlNc14C289G10205 [Albugo laibachii Nc14]